MTIGIERVNEYPLIRFDIRFERKFPIRTFAGPYSEALPPEAL